MLKTFRESLCAGILITIGGTVFLSCENKTVGAVLFSVALLCICYKSYYLFTGKIGYIVEQHKKQDFLNLAVGLFGNLIATFLLGMLLRTVLPNIGDGNVLGKACTVPVIHVYPRLFLRNTDVSCSQHL